MPVKSFHTLVESHASENMGFYKVVLLHQFFLAQTCLLQRSLHLYPVYHFQIQIQNWSPHGFHQMTPPHLSIPLLMRNSLHPVTIPIIRWTPDCKMYKLQMHFQNSRMQTIFEEKRKDSQQYWDHQPKAIDSSMILPYGCFTVQENCTWMLSTTIVILHNKLMAKGSAICIMFDNMPMHWHNKPTSSEQ